MDWLSARRVPAAPAENGDESVTPQWLGVLNSEGQGPLPSSSGKLMIFGFCVGKPAFGRRQVEELRVAEPPFLTAERTETQHVYKYALVARGTLPGAQHPLPPWKSSVGLHIAMKKEHETPRNSR